MSSLPVQTQTKQFRQLYLSTQTKENLNSETFY